MTNQQFDAPVPTQIQQTSSAINLPRGVSIADPWQRLGSYFLEVLLQIVTLYIGWIIWAALIASTGQTPAKRILKIRIITADTLRPASFAKMFWVRGLLGGIVAQFAIIFTIGVLAFMPLWDKRKQNIWDKVSNTYAVTDPNDAWNTKPKL